MSAASARLPVAVIGLGAVGRMHAERLRRHPDVTLAGIAEPSPAGQALAAEWGVPWQAEAQALLDQVKPGAVIVATPNATHVDVGLCCVQRGLPLLMEKPVADTVDGGLRLVRAAAAAGVPMMVGHQRRHNPILRRAHRLVQEGAIGRPVAAQAMATWLKPDAYFQTAWRRQPGGGPVLINLIHDVDLLRHLLGDVVQVQAQTAGAVRGFDVEDTAAVLLRFAGGALATLLVSDCTPAPWNWDLAAGEAAHYPRQDVDSHHLCGTDGALTLPGLALWRYRGERGWHEELSCERSAVHSADPYALQLRHLRAVAEGRETPLCSGLDGLRTLQATLAVHTSAASGQPVDLAPLAA